MPVHTNAVLPSTGQAKAKGLFLGCQGPGAFPETVYGDAQTAAAAQRSSRLREYYILLPPPFWVVAIVVSYPGSESALRAVCTILRERVREALWLKGGKVLTPPSPP